MGRARQHTGGHGPLGVRAPPVQAADSVQLGASWTHGFGLISIVARFVLGLGGSTHFSDTYAWGLWIVFDLIWIAVAAGAFATAGIIYVFQRKDLYSHGPFCRAHGPVELFVRHGHSNC